MINFCLLFLLYFCILSIKTTDSQYTLSTIAGSGTSGGNNGPALSAQINTVQAIWGDSNGDIYLAEYSPGRIRKLSGGILSTIAGTGSSSSTGAGGPATSMSLDPQTGVYGDTAGQYMFFCGNYFIWRYVYGTTQVERYGGALPANAIFAGDGGQATAANFNNMKGMYVSTSGVVYVTDSINQRIRTVDTSGIVTTFAGDGTGSYGGDGSQATSAQLNRPYGIWADSNKNTFIADRTNNRIRKVDSSGIMSTVAGTGASSSDGDSVRVKLTHLPLPCSLSCFLFFLTLFCLHIVPSVIRHHHDHSVRAVKG